MSMFTVPTNARGARLLVSSTAADEVWLERRFLLAAERVGDDHGSTRPRVEGDIDGLEGAHHLTAVEVVAPMDPMGRPFVDRDRGAEALDPGPGCRETVQLHAGLHHRPAHQLPVGPLVELRTPSR